MYYPVGERACIKNSKVSDLQRFSKLVLLTELGRLVVWGMASKIWQQEVEVHNELARKRARTGGSSPYPPPLVGPAQLARRVGVLQSILDTKEDAKLLLRAVSEVMDSWEWEDMLDVVDKNARPGKPLIDPKITAPVERNVTRAGDTWYFCAHMVLASFFLCLFRFVMFPKLSSCAGVRLGLAVRGSRKCKHRTCYRDTAVCRRVG